MNKSPTELWEKNRIEIYRRVAVSFFSIIYFPHKGEKDNDDSILYLSASRGLLRASIIHVTSVFWVLPAKFPSGFQSF